MTQPPPERWIRWIAERALQGTPPSDLVDGLAAAGVAREEAASWVEGVWSSPIFAAARAVVGEGRALHQVVQLEQALDAGPLTERTTLDEDTLYREHWICHRPMVLRGAASAWPAARWTFALLRDRFAFAPLDVLVRPPRWWLADRRTQRMSFGALVDVILGPPGDGLYADGRTNVLDQAGLAPLRAELGLLPGLAGDGSPRAWVGPGGTVTPTHHDQSTAWQVQLVGRKRVFLASPREGSLAATAEGLYNDVDPRLPSSSGVRWHEVVLEAGDALLVPVGFWHHVEALEPSFSVSFSGFRWPNVFPWYLPGGDGRPTAA